MNWTRVAFFVLALFGLGLAYPEWPASKKFGIGLFLFFGTAWLIEVLLDANL